MFEKKIFGADPSESGQADSGEDALRNLSWSELAARLAAARDLRTELDLPGETGQASFDADFARHLLGREHGKPSVNPNGLAHGKQGPSYSAGSNQNAATGNRGS